MSQSTRSRTRPTTSATSTTSSPRAQRSSTAVRMRRPASWLVPPTEVFGEEPLGRLHEAQAVLRSGKAVPLVGEQQVLVGYPALLHGRDDLLRLGLLHARVVRPL